MSAYHYQRCSRCGREEVPGQLRIARDPPICEICDPSMFPESAQRAPREGPQPLTPEQRAIVVAEARDVVARKGRAQSIERSWALEVLALDATVASLEAALTVAERERNAALRVGAALGQS